MIGNKNLNFYVHEDLETVIPNTYDRTDLVETRYIMQESKVVFIGNIEDCLKFMKLNKDKEVSEIDKYLLRSYVDHKYISKVHSKFCRGGAINRLASKAQDFNNKPVYRGVRLQDFEKVL